LDHVYCDADHIYSSRSELALLEYLSAYAEKAEVDIGTVTNVEAFG
jgi:hypothetical protein